MEFKEYYLKQKALQDLFQIVHPGSEAIHTGNSEIDEAKFEKHVLLMIKEVTEVLDEINYKPHVKNRKPVDKDRITEELADTMKFLLNLLIIMDISPEDFERKYAEKHQTVAERIRK